LNITFIEVFDDELVLNLEFVLGEQINSASFWFKVWFGVDFVIPNLVLRKPLQS
jgi:hypothetical protein